MKAQFFSGYILSTVQECLSTYNSTVNITSLLSQLSAFDVEYNFDAKFATDPIVSVYENIIARGQPTLPSLFVEETISSALNIAVKESDEQRLSSIVFKPTIRLTALEAKIYKSLFVIDPRIKILDSQYYRYEPLDYLLPNENELFFITKTLPKRFGEAFCQLIETQREIVSTINPKIERKFGINEAFRSSGSAFVDQRLDFSFDLPSADRFTSGLAIEIDGPQHREQSQMNLDAFRDKILLEIGWEPTIRLRTKELVSLPPDKQEALSTFLHHPYCIKVVENFRRPIWADQDGLEALQIALSPFGIARV